MVLQLLYITLVPYFLKHLGPILVTPSTQAALAS